MLARLRKLFARDELIERLARSYGLAWVESNVYCIATSAMPQWWFGHCGTVQFGIRSIGDHWETVVGRIPSVIDLELTRITTKARYDSTVRLEEFVPPGHPLALRFRVTMIGHTDERFLGPQLGSTKVADPLSELGESVPVVGLYRWGLELHHERSGLTLEAFDRDLRLASQVALGLAGYAEQFGQRCPD